MRRLLVPLALVAACLVAGLVFSLDPSLDLRVAAVFYIAPHDFAGQTPLGMAARRVFYWIPTVLAVGVAALYGARRLGLSRWWAPTARGVIFVLLTFALGPGLLVNGVFKDHSHRPRPYQTQEFGGDEAFRPFYRFDGACRRNCSFVSGEGATSAWTLAPALLAPPPVRMAAIAASLVFAACSGFLRVSFGGHYLSDSIFAVLLVWATIWVAWISIRPRDDTRPS